MGGPGGPGGLGGLQFNVSIKRKPKSITHHSKIQKYEQGYFFANWCYLLCIKVEHSGKTMPVWVSLLRAGTKDESDKGRSINDVRHFLAISDLPTVMCKKVQPIGSVWCKMALGEVGVSLP